MKMTLFALISLLTGAFLSAQTPSPRPTSKIPPKIPVRDFFRNPASRGYDLCVIQDDLGHRDPKHTTRYTRSAALWFAGLWE